METYRTPMLDALYWTADRRQQAVDAALQTAKGYLAEQAKVDVRLCQPGRRSYRICFDQTETKLLMNLFGFSRPDDLVKQFCLSLDQAWIEASRDGGIASPFQVCVSYASGAPAIVYPEQRIVFT